MQTLNQQYEKFKMSISDASPWLSAWCEHNWNLGSSVEFPTQKSEEWKYTPLRDFLKQEFQWNSEQVAYSKISEIKSSQHRIVFVDGVYSFEHSNVSEAQGFQIYSLKDLLLEGWNKSQLNEETYRQLLSHFQNDSAWKTKENKFDHINSSFLLNGSLVYVDKNTKEDEPIQIIQVVGAKKDLFTPIKNVIYAAAGSQFSVIETQVSVAEEACSLNTSTDLFCEANSHVHYCKLQDVNFNSYVYHSFRTQQKRDSYLNVSTIDLGGRLSRNNTYFDMAEDNAYLDYNGLYLAEDSQNIDNSSYIRHNSEHTYSHQLFKGVLVDKSQATFNGRLYIAKDAQQVNSSQLNKNLVLSDKATINTKPQLEVYADDVKASHGATIGQLDANELFYLMSRAIPKEQAIPMLAQGFIGEVIYKIKNDALREFVLKYVFNRFADFLKDKQVLLNNGEKL